MIRGPGTGTSDSIVARVSNGEFVVNAAMTAAHRPLLEAINAGRAHGYAAGGYVSRALPSLPRGGAAGGSGPQVSVQIVNESGVPVQAQTETSRTGDGGVQVRAYIRRVTNENIARGDHNAVLGGRYGARSRATPLG
jgi:hypothetical protein